jgi:hypothetical protein
MGKQSAAAKAASTAKARETRAAKKAEDAARQEAAAAAAAAAAALELVSQGPQERGHSRPRADERPRSPPLPVYSDDEEPERKRRREPLPVYGDEMQQIMMQQMQQMQQIQLQQQQLLGSLTADVASARRQAPAAVPTPSSMGLAGAVSRQVVSNLARWSTRPPITMKKSEVR